MGEVSVCDVCVCVCVCSSTYFFRPDVFTVQRFFTFCLVAVMGRFVPLPGTAFFWGRTSTPEEEVEGEEDEEADELLPSLEDAELSSRSCRLRQSGCAKKRWLHHPCRLGDPRHFGAGGKIRSGPQVGKVAT